MDTAQQVERFRDFFEKHYYDQILEKARIGEPFLVMDFSLLISHDPFLAEELLDDTEEVLKAAEFSIKEFDIENEMRIRISNLPSSQKILISDVRSKHLTKFLCIEGIIRLKTDVRPQVVSARFECPQCGNVFTILQLDKKMREPSKCSCGRKGKFRMIGKKLIDVQKIVVEETPDDLIGSDQPKKLSIFLKEDLTSPFEDKKTIPGNKIRINGILKEVPIVTKGGVLTKYDVCIEANHIQVMEETFEELKITPEQVDEILGLSKDKDLLKKISNSIAPHIEGYDEIKKALALQLFGGVDIKKEDGSLMYPGNIHLMLIGDPGSAKSQILLSVSKLCPKSRYISGRGASGVGLTASIVKDEDFQGGYALAAGVVVLAHKGIALLDEFDKIEREDTTHLHEAMAHQTIHIAKANIQATLKAATSILAAANPEFSRFDWNSPIGPQIKFEASLLNRFDLIFPVYDRPDEEKDKRIAKKILGVFRDVESAKGDIDPKLLRAYISYAKNHIVPKMEEYSDDYLTAKYVEIRSMYKNEPNSPIPLNARQLITIIKLATAAAKLRLSCKIEKRDLDIANEILMGCLKEVGIDKDTGKLDIDRISAETTFTQRDRIFTVLDILRQLQDQAKGPVPIDHLINVITERTKIGINDLESILEKLKRNGDIFEPRVGFWQML